MNDIIVEQIKKINITQRTYVYFEKAIIERILELKSCFPEWTILYSIKANPNKDIIKCSYNNGLGFDVATINELELLLQYQSNSLIQYSCPGKSDSDIKKAMQSKCVLVADSISELNRIYYIQKSIKPICEFGIRLNIGDKNEHLTESMVGEESHFGITLFELSEFFKVNKCKLPITHVHVYSGSQILDENTLLRNFSNISKIVLDLINKYSLSLKSVSFGGGFGVPYTIYDNRLNLTKLKDLISNDASINRLKKMQIRLCVESGRFLVAESGYFIACVRDVKYRHNLQIVIVDGLMNAFFRPAFLGVYHNIIALRTGEAIQTKVVGNTCTPLDSFPCLVKLPRMFIGDKLIFENAGAYGLSMSPLKFISFDEVEEVYVK